MLQALAGLSEAHSLGIVHRDLKPGNLFVTWRGGQPDRVKILDFGISKRLFDDGGPKVTTANSVLGSPAYMAPEQLRGNAAIDGRTDIWSAGVILYELLTGELPFSGPNAGAVFAAILENDPTPPAMLRPDLPVGIDEVVLKCLARKPADRYTTVAELAEALAPFASPVGQQTLDFLRRKVPGFRVSLVDGLEAAAPSKTGGIGTTPDVLVQSVPPRSVRRPSADLVEKHTEKPPRGGLFWSAAIAVALVAGAGVGLGLKRDKNATGPPPPAAPSSMPTVAPASGMPAASQAASAALASASASASLASASTYAAIASAGTSAASPPVVPVTVSTRPRPSPSKGKPTKVIDDEAIFQRH
jgi:serine/threonine-protein kinase